MRSSFRKELGKFLFPAFPVAAEFRRGRMETFPEFPVKGSSTGELESFGDRRERLTGMEKSECRGTEFQLFDISVRGGMIGFLPVLIE